MHDQDEGHMSIYLAGTFQCKDCWELIDSANCTRPLAELTRWMDGWTLEIFAESLTCEAENIVLDFLSQHRRGGGADELHVIGELEPRPALPVWLL